MFSKKATKIDKIVTVDLTFTKYISVKSTVKIYSIFVAVLENMNFIREKKTFMLEFLNWINNQKVGLQNFQKELIDTVNKVWSFCTYS